MWMTWAVVSGPPGEALARAPAKGVKVDRVDARGCGEVVVAGQAVQGAAPGLCVVQALWAPLEGGVVALLVRAPHRFEEEERLRVFIYRLEGRRLVPRFLGSGFASREVRRLVALDDALGVEVSGDGGVSVLRCSFDGFPLVCRDDPLLSPG
ncbi:MAG: hypothetical protein AMXMBFR34_39190 [Myxococcaceae bacterium]